MKKYLFLLTCLLVFMACNNQKESNEQTPTVIADTTTEAQRHIVSKNEICKEGECIVPCEQHDTILWDNWFKENHKSYIYIFDEVSENHQSAINDLLSFFYADGYNCDMIQWRLDQFYPQEDTTDDFLRHLNTERQVDSLLNFNVEKDSYQVRHKSALIYLMQEFRQELYEDKLRNSIQDVDTKFLFDKEQEIWQEYLEATANTFEIMVLRKESYYLKKTFLNNYVVDIMESRIKSLLYMRFIDKSILGRYKEYGYDKVESAYDDIEGQITETDNVEYEYSYDEKMNALKWDKIFYQDFMKIHTNLLEKLNLNDTEFLFYEKRRTLNGLMDSYDKP